ncbi:hypothetical protein [Xanthomonas hortorum]|uniref:Uncharacterized protein n=2 Tax=Xanthomonas hortorum TaxID=56454 RepID=A0A9X4H417_9XANT|nr:hypothetical protein [Xanthomonas hortorum]MCE4355087.1 hypothetical protein [Xanthomonas hortorum pv. pelargonii]MCE4373234.1 hypothetical protein [Xanthomonas hortorum pv. hederae]MCM5523139.1 hypothetical protein [Xanthomonas hortorum pv. pelargonii]MCM5535452.1 hypothetical protein [Xanthomonas hortorum pv. pelargonii]MCM5539457.1 hypothetical protein [Xanthomonas hortorum pv. pelargonii]
MRPQAEFIALSTLAGGVAMMFATALQQLSFGMLWSDTFKWALPALVAAGIGAWLALRWQRRGDAPVPTRRSGGMAVRTVLLSALSYVPAVALYLAIAFAVSGGATAGRLDVLLLAVLFGCLPLLWAAVPFSMIEYVLCRRYLRRVRVPAGSP